MNVEHSNNRSDERIETMRKSREPKNLNEYYRLPSTGTTTAAVSTNSTSQLQGRPNTSFLPPQGSNSKHSKSSNNHSSKLRQDAISSSSSSHHHHHHQDQQQSQQSQQQSQFRKISERDLEVAFAFLDVNDTGQLNKEEVKNILSSFFVDWTPKEYRLLLNDPNLKISDSTNNNNNNLQTNTTTGEIPPLTTTSQQQQQQQQQPFTLESLKNLMLSNENSNNNNNIDLLQNHDPIREAFKVYDPLETGYISTEVLQKILQSMGLGVITAEDIKCILTIADFDGDGRISLNDFRRLLLLQS